MNATQLIRKKIRFKLRFDFFYMFLSVESALSIPKVIANIGKAAVKRFTEILPSVRIIMLISKTTGPKDQNNRRNERSETSLCLKTQQSIVIRKTKPDYNNNRNIHNIDFSISYMSHRHKIANDHKSQWTKLVSLSNN